MDKNNELLKGLTAEETINALKKQYGQIYQVDMTLETTDEEEELITYFFTKPKTPSYHRYIKNMSKDIANASLAFVNDNIVAEQRELLKEHVAAYPAIAINLSQKLLAMLGFTDKVILRKL